MSTCMRLFFNLLPIVVLLTLVSSCIEDSGDPLDPQPASTTVITGSVFMPPAGGASVSVKSVGGRLIAGPVATENSGSFSIDVPSDSLAADLVFESCKGASRGADSASCRMAAYVRRELVCEGAVVNITPVSTIIADLSTVHGLSPDAAESVFESIFEFGVDLAIVPRNSPLIASDTDTLSRLVFLRAAAFGRLTKDLGLTSEKEFELLEDIAHDLADSLADGMHGGERIDVTGLPLEDIRCRFAAALCDLQNDTMVNKTALNAAQIGALPFGTMASTASYRVEYVAGAMPAAMGKTDFKLKIANRSDGSPASGLSIRLIPKMYMATKNHSTPFEPIVADSANSGTYTCTIYYLMASGPGMGYWELEVNIGATNGECASFFPDVAMPMGSTTIRATLKGQMDSIASALGPTQRPYFLFNDGMSAGSTLNVFLATREDMMTHPALSTGTVLHDAAKTAWTANSIALTASTDLKTWVAGEENSAGHWSVPGLSGLVAGQKDTIFVKLTVNGDLKTTDGLAPSGMNNHAMFIVTF